ncbi:MAG: hypothetical protein ACRC7O_06165 [Fimbriiglobus sp.]
MGDWQGVYVAGRKKPLYYDSPNDWPRTIAIGHYESPCGGGDTIGSAGEIWKLVGDLQANYPAANFLVEGLLLSEDVKWTKDVSGVRCVFLRTPIDQCLKQIKARRAAAGNAEPLDPVNTVNRFATIEKVRTRLTELGVPCYRASADQAVRLALSWLRET